MDRFAYDDDKEYEKAIGDYSNAIRLDPKYTLAYINRGVSYFHTAEYDKAIADYTAAIRLNPLDADAYYNRGLSYKSKGKLRKAKADLPKPASLISLGNNLVSTLGIVQSNDVVGRGSVRCRG